MIESKRINIIAIVFAVIAVGAAIGMWSAGLQYISSIKEYSGIIHGNEDYYNDSNFAKATEITGGSRTVNIKGRGAYADRKTVYVTSGGYYNVSGNLNNIVVRSSDTFPVMIRLDGANIKSQSEPPIYIYKGSKCVISSKKDTDSYITDNRKKYSGQNINAAIYSIVDLTLNGEGTIHVESDYQDGIVSTRTLKTISGNLDITSKDDAVKAQHVIIADGKLLINSEGDGIQAKDNGQIIIDGGTTVINAVKDGIYSDGDITINDGSFNIYTGKGSEGSLKRASKNLSPPGTPPEMEQEPSKNAYLLPSMKGIKSDGSIHISGGSYILNADDDAIHSNNNIIIEGGEFTISAGDDAIHSNEALCINSGTITITDCYEGIESRDIEINGGDIDITAIDDGINSISDNAFGPPPDGGGRPRGGDPGRPEGPPTGLQDNGRVPPPAPPSMNVPDDETTEMIFRMNGGKLNINALGDGIDINGSCEMNGGTIIAFAKTDGPDLAFDFDGVFRMNGGTFMGAGNAGMIEEPSAKSKQHCLMAYLPITYRNGGSIEIQDSLGEVVESFSTDGSFCWIGWYGEQVRTNEKYTVLVDSEVIGEAVVSDIITVINPKNAIRNAPPRMEGGGPGGPPPDRPGGSGRPDGLGGPPPDRPGGGAQQDITGDNPENTIVRRIDLRADIYAAIGSVVLIALCIFFITRIKRRF